MKLITDRTPLDVERWRYLRDKGWDNMTDVERQEWMGEIVPVPAATKGMYTHKDLNRVEKAVKELSERMTMLGYTHPKLVIKTDWTYTDTFWRDDYERYLGNLAALVNSISVYEDTPDVPSVKDKLNYALANEIEKILVDLSTILL